MCIWWRTQTAEAAGEECEIISKTFWGMCGRWALTFVFLTLSAANATKKYVILCPRKRRSSASLTSVTLSGYVCNIWRCWKETATSGSSVLDYSQFTAPAPSPELASKLRWLSHTNVDTSSTLNLHSKCTANGPGLSPPGFREQTLVFSNILR